MGELNPRIARDADFAVAQVGTIEAVAQWCECINGKAPLMRALEQLADSVGAEAVALARASREEGGASRVLAFDRHRVRSGPRLERSHARAVLGAYFDTARPGTVWFKSMIEGEIDPRLSGFHARRRLNDLVVIPLATGDRTADFLEFHFCGRDRLHLQAVMNMLADTLATTWSNRAPGLFTDALLRVSTARKLARPGMPILSMDNPARLSRAEYRVCVLLSHGKTALRVRQELKIGESTLRTHLRNIYAKTGVQNMSELIYGLLSVTPFSPDADVEGRIA